MQIQYLTFFSKSEDQIVHILTENNDFSSTRRTTMDSWHEEVRSIRIALDPYKNESGFVAFEYEEIIKESYPDLIIELGITHAGVNIVSKEYDERYSSSQRPIGGGYLLMTNSSTEQKYEDLVFINEQLELGYTIELLSLDGTPLTLKEREPRPDHSTIKVTFPNGKVINHNRVFKTLVEVVEYAGPERVEKLNIIVCYKNLILRQPHDTYPVACKPVGEGWHVNTYTNTETKCSQIQLISDALGLGLKAEILE